MTMPDWIKITHQPKTKAPPAALTSDDIPPGPLSEDDLRQRWNQQADQYNQWESLDSRQQLAWAQALAIKADRHAALKAEPGRKGPTDEDLYNLAEQFNGDPVPAMRRVLELWGNPLQGAPAPGENPATPPAPELGDAARPTYLDAIRLAQGCHDFLGGYTGAEGQAWHGAIDTVVGVLKRAAVGPWDSQTRAVFGVGVEAGEVAVPEPVSECPHCGYEGEMVPALHAGEVAA
jgi:hypothetical protein